MSQIGGAAVVVDYPAGVLTPELTKAARALLKWTQADLAKASQIPLSNIKNFERGSLDPRASLLAQLERAITGAGVLILEPGDTRDGGQGLRFARRG